MRETIEARELCGAHIGRIVQITIRPSDPRRLDRGDQQPAPFGGELAGLSHDGSRVYVSFRGLHASFDAAAIAGQMIIDPDDRVVVDAFEAVAQK